MNERATLLTEPNVNLTMDVMGEIVNMYHDDVNVEVMIGSNVLHATPATGAWYDRMPNGGLGLVVESTISNIVPRINVGRLKMFNYEECKDCPVLLLGSVGALDLATACNAVYFVSKGTNEPVVLRFAFA